jgi:hypothetical protein
MPPAVIGAAVGGLFAGATATVVTAVTTAVVTGVYAGAVMGAATSLVTGGDILEGALRGAAIGGITGGVLSLASGLGAGVAGESFFNSFATQKATGSIFGSSSAESLAAAADATTQAGTTLAGDVGQGMQSFDPGALTGIEKAKFGVKAVQTGVNATKEVVKEGSKSWYSAFTDPEVIAGGVRGVAERGMQALALSEQGDQMKEIEDERNKREDRMRGLMPGGMSRLKNVSFNEQNAPIERGLLTKYKDDLEQKRVGV